MLSPGKYKAKAVSGKFGTADNEKRTKCIAVTFEVNDEGKKEYVIWKGWLTPAAEENTWKAMAIMGYREDLGYEADGSLDASYFDGTEVQIVVDEESYQGKDGQTKTFTKVKYVNRLGGSNYGLADTETSSLPSKSELQKHMLVARQQTGIKKPNKVVDKTPNFDETGETPF